MSGPAVAFALASAAYLGFQATVRVVVYPQFARVPGDGFAAYERAHQQRISVVVGPLFAALVLSSAALVLSPPTGARWLVLAAPATTALLLAVTAFGAVPQHRRLTDGFDARAHRRLLQVDTVRLLVAAAGAAVGAALVVS